MVKKILLLIAVVLTGVSAQAGVWVGETPAAGDFYIYNPTHNVFLKAVSTVTTNPAEATLFTLSAATDCTIAYDDNGTTNYVYESAGNQTWGTTNANKWKIQSNNGGYYISHTDPSYLLRTRYINTDGSGVDYPRQNFTNNNRTWIFISKAQYEAKVNVTAAQGNGPNSYGANVYVVETYAGDNDNFVAGKVLSKSYTDLKNGYYTLEFYATASKARGDAVNAGKGIAQIYLTADDATTTLDMSVWEQDAVTPDDAKWLHTYTVKVTDGTLEYGIQNVAEGGNWYVIQHKSLTFLGDTKANIAVNADAQYATFCAPFDVTLPEGVTACTIDGVDGDALAMTAVEGVVPANTPVVLNGALAATALYGNAVDALPEEGVLVGVYEDTHAPVGSYVLQNQSGVVGFFKVETAGIATVPANRAYLNVASDARFFGFDAETAISAIDALTSGKAEIFDLQGRRLNSLQKGINIVNGVKVLVK